MDKDGTCRQGQASKEVAVIRKWFWWREKLGAAGHEAAIAESRVGAACEPKMQLRLVYLSEDRRCSEGPIFRRKAGQHPRQKNDFGRRRDPHFR